MSKAYVTILSKQKLGKDFVGPGYWQGKEMRSKYMLTIRNYFSNYKSKGQSFGIAILILPGLLSDIVKHQGTRTRQCSKLTL